MTAYTKVLSTLLMLAFLALGAACGSELDPVSDRTSEVEKMRTTGLALTSDTLGDTDVGGMKFTVDQISCDTQSPTGLTKTASKDFEDLYLPGGIGVFENKPYDEDSKHLFSDHYFLLPAGCYNVLVEPMTASNTPSQDCKPADKDNVEVKDGKTREIHLISQCDGPERGGLDVIASVNHPPQIENFEFKSSKFLSQCTENIVCATVKDPDADPLLVARWFTNDRGTFKGAIEPVSSTQLSEDTWEFCAEVATGPQGDYQFLLRVWDRAYDENGKLVHIEHLLDDQGNSARSRDQLHFPIYSGVDCQGRSAVVLMALKNSPAGPDDQGYSTPFIRQLASWVDPLSSGQQPKILYVKDDNHNNEHPNDPAFVQAKLELEYPGAVTYMDEPATGLTDLDLDGYDILWFANPGYPMDDPASYDALQNFLASGRGLVIQGDDMAGPSLPNGRDMNFFSRLDYVGNGTEACGDKIDNNQAANYQVQFENNKISILDGLRNQTFEYGNDIDHTTPQNSGERILATARYSNTDQNSQVCSFETPAAVSINPIDL